MKMQLECYPCLLRHGLEMLRIVNADQAQHRRVLQQVSMELSAFDTHRSPPEMAQRIYRIVCQETGERDPYLTVKQRSTREALALYPRLKALAVGAENPLETAIRVSIAGNIIDASISLDYDLERTLARVLTERFAIEAFAPFQNMLEKSSGVLFLADNAGETVFDRVLIEMLGKPVTYVVKGGPIMNDATVEDACSAGISRIATVIDNGCDAPGTVIGLCSKQFRHLFAQAELIIAKGQANYETLSGVAAPLFFLLQAKCAAVARDLGVPVNSIVFKRNSA
jgi:uncharacterized protein with ATP-grasp and redox domains